MNKNIKNIISKSAAAMALAAMLVTGEAGYCNAKDFGITRAEIITVKAAESFDYVVSNVNEYVNVRAEASTSSAIIGKLKKNSYGKILSRGEKWTKIESGEVVGYVSNKYLLFDEDAIAKLTSLKKYKAIVNASKVNVRKGTGTDTEKVGTVDKGTRFNLIASKSTDEWICVRGKVNGKTVTAYIYAKYVDKVIDLAVAEAVGTGNTENAAVTGEKVTDAKESTETTKTEEETKTETKEETKAETKEETKTETKEETKAETKTETKAEGKKDDGVPERTTRAAVTLSDEDIIKLATIVYMESNCESYEGQLAVANVVINRLVSGIWGDTLDDVLYAPNQFAGAKTNIPKYKNKINESNIKAAKEAAAGNNNIGDYMYFRTVRGANLASYKKYYILGNHVFH